MWEEPWKIGENRVNGIKSVTSRGGDGCIGCTFLGRGHGWPWGGETFGKILKGVKVWALHFWGKSILGTGLATAKTLMHKWAWYSEEIVVEEKVREEMRSQVGVLPALVRALAFTLCGMGSYGRFLSGEWQDEVYVFKGSFWLLRWD